MGGHTPAGPGLDWAQRPITATVTDGAPAQRAKSAHDVPTR